MCEARQHLAFFFPLSHTSVALTAPHSLGHAALNSSQSQVLLTTDKGLIRGQSACPKSVDLCRCVSWVSARILQRQALTASFSKLSTQACVGQVRGALLQLWILPDALTDTWVVNASECCSQELQLLVHVGMHHKDAMALVHVRGHGLVSECKMVWYVRVGMG